MNEESRLRALKILSETYAGARPALHYNTAFELLVAVILSAQCTDERVNKVTAELFKQHNTPETMLALSQEQLEGYIFSCGLYRSKAAHILSASRDILEKFGGQVPAAFADLRSLAGVGQKTSNVVSSVWFDNDAIAVDTHVFRVSNRLGLAHARTPAAAEEQLKAVIPQADWSKAHHWLIWHGRRVCHAQKPACGGCPLAAECDFALQGGPAAPAARQPAKHTKTAPDA